MKAASAIRKLPLHQLVLSPLNVRKTAPSATEDAELKASLKSSGLKQNLVVYVSPNEDDVYAVTAGGRRLNALRELAAEGEITADYKVPCVVEAPEAALETSLMENTIRAAMHPADEFAAMAELVDRGDPISAVALRFGVAERVVQQRLRLGKLAPKLLDAFRAGDLSLELAMAFTLAADPKTQLAAWRQIKDQPYPSAHAVRRLLTEGAVSLNSALGRFVDTAAYEAAGGTLRRDLFSTDDDGFMDDAALVRRLAIEKLEAKAEELKSTWSWTKALLDPEYGFESGYSQIKGRPAGLSPKLAKELESMEQRLAELDAIEGDDWTEEFDEEAERLGTRRTKLTKKGGEHMIYADEVRRRAGCIVTIGDEGDFELHEGLVEPDLTEGEELGGAAGGDDTSAENEPEQPASAERNTRKECGFSQSLVDDLKAHRLQITKAHLAGDFELAFDLALYSLCVDVLKVGRRSRPLSLSAVETLPQSSLNDLAGTPADRLLEARKERLDTGWLKLPTVQSFQALAALSHEAKQDLFAWCIAACLHGQLGIEDDANPVLEGAGQRLAIPLAECWRPTAANYWGRAKKAHGLGIAEAVLGPRWARDHADDKKATLAAALEKAFNRVTNDACIGLDHATREGAGAWLPPGMAYPESAADGDAARTKADDLPGTAQQDDSAAPDDELPAFLNDAGPSAGLLNGCVPPGRPA